MLKSEIKVGGTYLAKVGGAVTTVRVDAINDRSRFARSGREGVTYDVTNLRTGRKTVFRSAAKFRCEVTANPSKFTPKPAAPVTEPKVPSCGCGCIFHSEDEFGREVCDDCGEPWAESGKPKAQEASEEADPTTGATSGTGSSATSSAPSTAVPSTVTASASSGAQNATLPVQVATTEGEQCSDPTSPSTNGLGSSASNSAGATPATVAADRTQTAAAPQAGVAGAAIAVPQQVTTSLAARIAATRTQRPAGRTVAGMTPNEEQEAILQVAMRDELRVLVIAAGAGTGKTATLRMLEETLPGRGQYTAFNTSLVAESKAKFRRASCNTTHSLAFRAVGRKYQHRLGGERMRSSQVARVLGIDALPITLKSQGPPQDCPRCTGTLLGRELCPVCNGQGTVPTDKVKVLQADFLAGQVLVAVRRFCQSADREIGAQHLRYIDGIDGTDADGRRQRDNNDRVVQYLLPFCKKAWDDLSRVDGQLPFSHDCYVKLWQLGTGTDRPIIAADYILLDEAQDTAPVFLDVLKQQSHALLIFVGDSNQAIYEWRGAVDAMRAYPDAERRLLSQSYRFGQSVADVANAVLADLEEPTDLVMRGNPAIPTRVAEVAEPRCYLYRTNAGAVGRVMAAIAEGKRPYLIGGGADVVAWCEAALDLQAKRGTRHPELACFESWGEVVEYSKTDEGSDLKLMVKLVIDFGADAIRDALKDMPAEDKADLVVSTAHKSKGREWDTVKLGPDFPLANKMTDPDRRLLYVAATRAKLVLDVTECPPFCGGNDTDGGNRTGEWVPGLEIRYTQPMPTEADIAAYAAGRGSGSPAAATTPPAPAAAPTAVPAAPAACGNGQSGNGSSGEFTWSSKDGGWCVRGPSGKEDQRVTVVRKNGTKSVLTLGKMIRRIYVGNGNEEVWFYEVK